MSDWNIEKAHQTYRIAQWGEGYFDVDPQGRLRVRPDRDSKHAGVDLFGLCQEIREAGLNPPVLVRFPGILRDRVRSLHKAFTEAREEFGYRGDYTSVYPIKVNQQRRVVEEILKGVDGGVGLECGSKPELMAVLGLSQTPGRVIICNGYKDREYVRLALIGKALGHRVFIVVEKLSELQLVIQESRLLGIAPSIGVRVRLASLGRGKWQNTGGERAKFGLLAEQLLRVVERLRDENMLGSLQLLHVHMGSQIANIRDIQNGMRECARYYSELRRLGADVQCVDVGGGLSIDYDGTGSRSEFSMNYSVMEYAKNIVQTLFDICDQDGLPHPEILTESGRAMTAQHAVLVTEVVDREAISASEPQDIREEDHPTVINLYTELQDLRRGAGGRRSLLESYHDAVHWIAEIQSMYQHGIVDLEQRARAEQYYQTICRWVQARLPVGPTAHREVLDELNEKLADKYFCNFSIFQSLPDVWAMNQIFPIVPLHRLDETPDRRVIIEDITCDSDGRIDFYVDAEGVDSTLPLHELRDGEPYLLGVFLVGAYQEILGDLHNLFGDTNSVHVEVDADGQHRLLEPLSGDTVDTVLRQVAFQPEQLLHSYREQVQRVSLDANTARTYLKELEAGITGYTYLED
jgi:arginine decarboxylase